MENSTTGTDENSIKPGLVVLAKNIVGKTNIGLIESIILKSAIVDNLIDINALSAPCAQAIGKLVLCVWPGFRKT
jgi:hypothetical protein